MFSPDHIRVRRFETVPSLPEPLKPLLDIAYNLGWSWHPVSADLFVRIDRDLWHESKHNPLKVLGRSSQARLEELAEDESYLRMIESVYRMVKDHRASPGWFEKTFPDLHQCHIAYYCAEFGLTECFRNYSGGLGILAGDHLKSASGLGLPLTAVGLLYGRGYFQQYLNNDGWQQEYTPDLDVANLPIRPALSPEGEPVRVSVELPGRAVQLTVWAMQVGRVRLLLLDANVPENDPSDRDITAQLYGGNQEMRIKQELILGVGGRRALAAVGVEPTVRHMNEGHAAFQALEEIRMTIERHDLSFDQALRATAAGNLFTTHTPVPAGIDRFPPELAEAYLAPLAPGLRLGVEGLLRLGRARPDDQTQPFSMAVLALRTSDRANGVAALHGRVSRAMWADLWPGTPPEEVPIGHVTNGVHLRTWLGHDLAQLIDRYLPARWRSNPEDPDVWKAIDQIPDEDVWRVHELRRHRLVRFLRGAHREQARRRGGSSLEVEAADDLFNPKALTIGFARRFATYKRADLLFRNPERLMRLLCDPKRPVQIVFAGKAHPADTAGKELIKKIVHFARDNSASKHLFFAENYDMEVARHMVQGVDLWLNTPRRPMEASGTSGMKAAMNGVLNCSVADGWWDEAPRRELGWAIGSGEEYDDHKYQDEVESESLYDLLENEIIPAFYDRDEGDVPAEWVRKMKLSIRELAPRFNSHRMVQDYAHRYYAPAHRHASRLMEGGPGRAVALEEHLAMLREHWNAVRVVEVHADTDKPISVRGALSVVAKVELPTAIAPDMVSVQAYYGGVNPHGVIQDGRIENMTQQEDLGDGLFRFGCELVVGDTGFHGFAVRVIPHHPDLASPFVPGLMTWETTDSRQPAVTK